MQDMENDIGYLPQLESREEYIDHLEGYGESAPARNLVKTYMLETASKNHTTPDLTSLFPSRVHLQRLDDTLYVVKDYQQDENIVGLLEELDERHPVIYTTMKSEASNKWIREVVDQNPWLDRLWLSSPILFELWKHVQRTAVPNRYVRLGFDHEALNENISEHENEEDEPEDTIEQGDGDSVQGFTEHRKSRATITDRLSILNTKLEKLIELYDPLNSIVQLQMPSTGRGGHLLRYDGRATNRSDSFLDHRAKIKLVLKYYRNLTERVEERLWFEAKQFSNDQYTIYGAPVTITFGEQLSTATFNKFVDLGFRRRTSRLRIGGYITSHGPTKVHITAIDRHLWQPLLLEITSKQLLGVLPQGTCGNTIHRLITNVQRKVDPKIKVWLGSEAYTSDISESMGAST